MNCAVSAWIRRRGLVSIVPPMLQGPSSILVVPATVRLPSSFVHSAPRFSPHIYPHLPILFFVRIVGERRV